MNKTAPPPLYPSPQGAGDRVVPWASPVSQTSSPPPCGEEVGVVRRIDRARSLRHNATPPERTMWKMLRELKSQGFHFRRQVPIGRYFADFACHHPKLVIEVDGDTHGMAVAYDAVRDAFIRSEGYRVLRVGNTDVLRNREGVGRAILDALADLTTPTPNPSPQGGGEHGGTKVTDRPSSPLWGGDGGGGDAIDPDARPETQSDIP